MDVVQYFLVRFRFRKAFQGRKNGVSGEEGFSVI